MLFEFDGKRPRVAGVAAGVPVEVKKELSGRALEWVQMAAKEYREMARRLRIGDRPGLILQVRAAIGS